MKTAVLRQFYQRYLAAIGNGSGTSRGQAVNARRMALLLQVTQWQIAALSDEEYQHWT
ncbi:glucose uptake inhibitor SgrT [Sodalis sp. RH21]|uniref:glucose uptake inhibitor SgrT n=1 Tax=unclassified Sodalis (in: enterobacteria) TaxID=2636512 RepID=UPI0039B3B542